MSGVGASAEVPFGELQAVCITLCCMHHQRLRSC